jgi:predicted N-formylglutamate amidohydrolase
MRPRPRLALVVSCEHASNACPPDFDTTGIDPAVFETHSAWDPGARPIAERIAQHFGAPVAYGRWTRLYCDLNRSPSNPEVVPSHAFGVDIPSNVHLDAAARAARVEAHHRPYWDQVRGLIHAGLAQAEVVLHLSVHSFVEVYQGRHRAVDLGILIDPAAPREAELSRALMAGLAGSPYLVQENEPYDGRADALTAALRLELPPERYAGVELELSHRHLGRLDALGDTLIPALAAILHA